MDYGKYIIFTTDGVTEFPILFPSYIDHCDIANMFGHKAISAGRFEVGAEATEDDPMNISVWAGDKSVTLKLKSRGKEDAGLIQRLLRKQTVF
jgi:hypothetical protein